MKENELIELIIYIADNDYICNNFTIYLDNYINFNQLFKFSSSYIFRQIMQLFSALFYIECNTFTNPIHQSKEIHTRLDRRYFTLSKYQFFDFISKILIQLTYKHFNYQKNHIDEIYNITLKKLTNFKRPLNIVKTLIGCKVNELFVKLSQFPYMLENIFAFIPFESLFVIGFNLLKNDLVNSFQQGLQKGKLVGNYIPRNKYFNSSFIQIRYFRSIKKLFKSFNITLSNNNPIYYFTINFLDDNDLEILSKACAPVKKTSKHTVSKAWTYKYHIDLRHRINLERKKRRQKKRRHMKILKKWKGFVIRLMCN